MADVFISYARADQPKAAAIAARLEAAGHGVWWDRNIRGGAAYAADIERELRDARIVVVLWSAAACQSDWVKDEAVFARERHIILPISLDGVEQPLGFRQYQALDFSGWRGAPDAEPVDALLRAVAERLNAPAPAPRPPRKTAPNLALRLQIAAAGTLALAALAGGGALLVADQKSKARVKAPSPEVSVAVLPFADMSAARDQGPIADGVAEQILNALAKIDGLSVTSRTSAFVFRNEILPVGEIAARLRVRYVLEGSWFRAREAVKVQARLIDAADDRPIWSQDYSRTVTDPEDYSRIQEDIANAVASALRTEFGMPEPQRITIKTTAKNLSAYDLHLKARALYLSRRPAAIEQAIAFLERAVELDPEFAQGWEQLGAVYAVAPSYGVAGGNFRQLAAEANARALSLDDTLSMPYAVEGLALRGQYPTPWPESIRLLKTAVERDPRNTDALLWLGMNYVALGFMEKAVETLGICLKIDPAFSNCRKNRAVALMALGRDAEAFRDAQRNIEDGFLRDADVYIPLFLARKDRSSALIISGQINAWEGFPHTDFIAALADPDAATPEKYAEIKALGEAAGVDVASRSHVVFAFRAYDEITVERFGNAYENLWLPAFAGFRRSEAFRTLVRDLGVLDGWKAMGYPPQCRPEAAGGFACR